MKDPFKLPKGVGGMKSGLMWYDYSDKTFSAKLAQAILYYHREKPDYPNPNTVSVHPKTEIDKKPKGIKIVKDKYIMPNHLWIGVKE